jgi:hypothetical protein
MEATDARVAFPSFDEPAYKATFDISAIVDQGDTAISNNEIISDKPGPGNRHTIRFGTTPKMSSYLVALIVGDWKCVSDSVDGVKLGICTVPGKENLTHFPLEAGKAILHYYNDYYGIQYPLPKLDLIAISDFQAGAMENWGAIYLPRDGAPRRREDRLCQRPKRRGRYYRSRSGTPMVRRPCHRRMVGRHLAQRRICHLDDSPSPGGMEARLARRPGHHRRNLLFVESRRDYPGAIVTEINHIANLRYMAGMFIDSSGEEHGVEGASGMLGMSIDFPGAKLTTATGVNNAINIVGYYGTSNAGPFHGYLLMGGQFQTINFPGAIETRCNSVSDALEIVGRYTDSQGKIHGFTAK